MAMMMSAVSEALTGPTLVPGGGMAQCLSSRAAGDIRARATHDGCHKDWWPPAPWGRAGPGQPLDLAAASRADRGSQPSWDQTIFPDAETRANQGWSWTAKPSAIRP